MKGGIKTKRTDLPRLRRSLDRAGLFVEILTEKIGQINPTTADLFFRGRKKTP